MTPHDTPPPRHPWSPAATAEALLGALSRISQVVHSGEDWRPTVNAILALMGEVTGASRVWIFQTLDVGEYVVVQDYAFEWAAAPEHAQLDLQRFSLFRTTLTPEYRDLVKARQAGEHRAVLTRLLPDAPLRADMESQGIRAMLTVPIAVDGAWWGTLGLDDCVREVPWSEGEIAFLRTCADLIAAAIYRQQLDDRTRQFAIVEASADSGAWDWAFNPGRLWCSAAFFRLLSYPPPFPRLSLRRLLRHLKSQERHALMDQIRACLAGAIDAFRLDVQAARRGGGTVWLEIRAEAHRTAEGELLNISGLALEIEGRKQREASLLDEAQRDYLTGIFNRRAFMTEASHRLTTAPRIEEQHCLHLLAFDIDHFKRVNDRHGHDVGDLALQETVHRVATVLRHDDLFARIGGEEFVILLQGAASAGAETAERIRHAVAETPVDVSALAGEPLALPLTVSIGVATRRIDESLKTFLRRADHALYAAKHGGRDRVVVNEALTRPLAASA